MKSEKVTKQSEADFAGCDTCGVVFTSHFWHWSKAVASHKYGTGHKATLYRIVR